MSKALKIGTRGSKLALVQTEAVRRALGEHFPGLKSEVVVIKTRGDRILDTPLSKIGGKGLFISELEEALRQGGVDMVVHSLKDLPTELPAGLVLGGVLPRGEARDVLVSTEGRGLDRLTEQDRLATSSLRRQAQLLNHNPRLDIIDIRGNVDTRLRKLDEGYCTALVLAGAGLIRAGYADRISQYLDPALMLPAPAQGIIALEIRSPDPVVADLAAGVNHEPTFLCAAAERTFLRTLQGGCQIPIGCLATLQADGGLISGLIADLRGRRVIRKSLSSSREGLEAAAQGLAAWILQSGGREILESLREQEREQVG